MIYVTLEYELFSRSHAGKSEGWTGLRALDKLAVNWEDGFPVLII